MDLLLEVLLQLFVQLVVEVLYELLLRYAFEGAAALVRNRASGLVLSFVAGFAAGWLWGWHLAGNETWPKLFWVSAFLGVVAFGYAMTRPVPAGAARPAAVLAPPWQWDARRLVGLAVLNAGIALGIALAFGPSWSPVPSVR